MNVNQAIADKHLFRPFLADRQDKLSTWQNWRTALRAVYGLGEFTDEAADVVKQCTGRCVDTLPSSGFGTALFLTGRRSGKSRIAAIIGAYEAVLSWKWKQLAPGEVGYVPIISPSRNQSRIVWDYLVSVFNSPMLANEVVKAGVDTFELRNGVRIEILAGDYRRVRGFTLLACVVDEICFLGHDENSKVKSDTELIRAIQPGLATLNGRLVCISSPYAKRGWAYKQFKRHHGNDRGSTLVWKCDSRTMNETLPQEVVDKALAEDLQAAKSEYLGEFRDDVGLFIPRDVVERCVTQNCSDRLPREQIKYSAFVDVSGGRGDDAALAIGHRQDRTVVVDLVLRWRPPFDPNAVISEMGDHLRRYKIRRVVGDNYAANFVADAFKRCGFRYEQSKQPKAQLYLELLPRLCAEQIELVDDGPLVDQLANLERRTRAGGKDVIDHPHGGHDDLANAVAGVCVTVLSNKKYFGAIR